MINVVASDLDAFNRGLLDRRSSSIEWRRLVHFLFVITVVGGSAKPSANDPCRNHSCPSFGFGHHCSLDNHGSDHSCSDSDLSGRESMEEQSNLVLIKGFSGVNSA
ncbi:hypothetical protein ZIOFF_055252 [Zingiber officinale]|uniref:Uncharacterized protein n=1 Tax=Zingiber officinale TaxID=94328 RepID=A0A8J5FLG8_ZINOF|nr:hypothetical protein ZIOFF_055252 [Zingiber officinale]